MRLAALLASTVLSDDANSVLLPADGVHRLTALHSRFGRVPSTRGHVALVPPARVAQRAP